MGFVEYLLVRLECRDRSAAFLLRVQHASVEVGTAGGYLTLAAITTTAITINTTIHTPAGTAGGTDR